MMEGQSKSLSPLEPSREHCFVPMKTYKELDPESNTDKKRSRASSRRGLRLSCAKCRIAHRMATHNGYRPIKSGSSLAQLHPASAKISVDEDGLLPEWIIYHEHVVTSRPFLRKVSTRTYQKPLN